MNRLETMLYNAIMTLFEYNRTEYKGLNDELFIDFVCRNIGLSEAEYEELMTENTAECEWNLED